MAPEQARALQGMAGQPQPLPPSVRRDAMRRVIGLYDAWGRPQDGARWRKELAALKASR
jgi:hypothetical protein